MHKDIFKFSAKILFGSHGLGARCCVADLKVPGSSLGWGNFFFFLNSTLLFFVPKSYVLIASILSNFFPTFSPTFLQFFKTLFQHLFNFFSILFSPFFQFISNFFPTFPQLFPNFFKLFPNLFTTFFHFLKDYFRTF